MGCVLLAIAVLGLGVGSAGWAQEPTSDAGQFSQFLDAGEFSRALDVAQQLDGPDRDQALGALAAAQANSGALSGAIQSIGAMDDLGERSAAYDSLQSSPWSGAAPPFGGITAADFTDLIQLIQETIEPPTWDEENASIRPYVAGVFVDARGLLQRVKVDDQIDWRAALRDGDASSITGMGIPTTNGWRKISLTRLADEVRRSHLLNQHNPAARSLGGIYRIEYLAIDPRSGEIVIAGPAGPIAQDALGHWVNAENGQAVLCLDDLVECLRNALGGSGAFGCSIDPRPENLAATSKYLAETKLTNKPFRDGLQRSLGLQDINVFGIDPASHAAQILVEADYRMKCIGLGVEPSIPEVPSYWDRIELDENELPPALGLARWWFTVNYDAVLANSEKTLFAIRGPGVKVLSEDEMLARDGARVQTGTSTGPTRSFAEDFTRHYTKMCEAKPVFAELRNVFDMALVSGLIVQSVPRDRLEQLIGYLCLPESTSGAGSTYQTVKLPPPNSVDSVMNHKYYETKRGGKRQRHMVVAVGGGVQFDSAAVLKQQVVDTKGELDNQLAGQPASRNAWWWE